jgi:hypothetical protein
VRLVGERGAAVRDHGAVELAHMGVAATPPLVTMPVK